jgi:hypothetical protein
MEKLYVEENNGRRSEAVKICCDNCGKDFLKRKRFIKNSKNHFCCRECLYKFQKNTIKIKCDYCDNICEKTQTQLKNRKSNLVFCSRECKDKAQRLESGKKFNNLRPDHYGIGNGKYNYNKNAFNNKPNKCVDCGEDKKYLLCVHHIDGNRKNNVLENLEIVCANCHRKRHLSLIDGEWCYNTKFLTNRE